MNMTVGEAAALVDGEVVGDPGTPITGVNGVREAQPGDLCFVRDARYRAFLADSKAAAVIIAAPEAGLAMAQIVAPQPELAFARVLQHIGAAQTRRPATGVHPGAAVDESAQLGADVAIDALARVAAGARLGDRVVVYAGAYIGENVQIGADTVIYPNATIREDCVLGARCVIHANAVIGSDGFGFAPLEGRWAKIPQVGRAVLEDDVEIGSNSAVDRATFGETRIGQGTKIDNLVQIGHNVIIGAHCVIAGMAGISGSAVLGRHVRVAAQAGVAGHLDVGDGVTIAGRAGVTKSVPAGAVVSGFPAADHAVERRIQAGQRRVPELLKRVRQLERRLEALESERHG